MPDPRFRRQAAIGKAGRLEPSEYGFTWHVYGRDFRNYFMAGLQDGRVVALYATAASLRHGSAFSLGSISDYTLIRLNILGIG